MNKQTESPNLRRGRLTGVFAQWLPESMRWHLQLWLAGLLVCVLGGFGTTIYQMERGAQLTRVDNDLTVRIEALNTALRNAPFSRGPVSLPSRQDRSNFNASSASPKRILSIQSPAGQARSDEFKPGEGVRRSHPGPPPPGPLPDGPPPDGPPPDRPPPDGRRRDGPPHDRPGPEGPPPSRPTGGGPASGAIRPSAPPSKGSFGGQAVPVFPSSPVKPVDLPLPAATASLFGEGPEAFYYMTWYRDNDVLSRSPGAPRDVPLPPALQHDTLTHWRTRDGCREAFHCSGLGDCVLAGRSTTVDVAAMRSFALKLFGTGAAVLALALGAGWWLTGRAIRPIENISMAASRIASGNLSERIRVPNNRNELGRLASILNSTFARLESAFERQRQFTADAAHELRTPLAIMISETQTALTRRRTEEEYRETVEGCLDTAQQMRRLTESLLGLARFDSGDTETQRTEVDLVKAAQAVIERLKPLAEKQHVQLRGEFAPAFSFSSADRVSQVITNLLTNAIDYNRPDGEVCVSTTCESAFVLLAVTDTGPGIPAEDLPYIFDRFYRVDRSRSRVEGHTGLGLAICKAIVEAEGGTIAASSTLNVGTTFTIRFPLQTG